MTVRPSFAYWLLQQDRRNDPIGDLARDYRSDIADGCAPRSMLATVQDVRVHLELVHNAWSLALDALDAAETEWSTQV